MAVEKEIITPELKEAGNKLVWLKAARDEYDLPVYSRIMEQYSKFTEDIRNGRVVSAYALDRHGVVSAVSKMAFGNQMGVCLESSLDKDAIFAPAFGDIVAEVKQTRLKSLWENIL